MGISKLYGLVLAGGQSTRMGGDKGLIEYHGKPQRTYLFDLLSVFCENVFTSCRKDQDVPESLNPIADSFDFPGPLNGILSAFHTHPHHSWLAVAVDMPNVDDGVLKLLLDNRDEKKVATCFTHLIEGAFPEPLLTLWEPSAYPLLVRYTSSGKISPREFLETSDIKSIPVPDENILMNINSPQDKSGFKPTVSEN